jgi:hypothetical protein
MFKYLRLLIGLVSLPLSSQGVGASPWGPSLLLRRFEIPPLFLEGYSHSHVVTFRKEGRGAYDEAATKFDLAFWECLGHLLGFNQCKA